MKKRYEKLVFETPKGKLFETIAEEGNIFEISHGKEGELIIKTVEKDIESYTKPPIPDGYKYIEGKWNDGFVIERSSDGSQFVWVPVGSLDFDGDFPDELFETKYGRRNYSKVEFSKKKYHEQCNNILRAQRDSVEKYGGFYISRYNISLGDDGKPHSIKGSQPLVGISFNDAWRIVSTYPDDWCHLPYGSDYDSVLAWFIKSGARTLEEIRENSTNWGNFPDSEHSNKEISLTGSNEKWCTNRIYDFAGNVSEFTFENEGETCRVCRGGSCKLRNSNVNSRHICLPNSKYLDVGFRIVLYIR